MVFQKGNRLYKLRRTYKGEQNPFYGKNHKEESKLKMGSKKGNIPWNKGIQNIYSKETLQKMKEAKHILYCSLVLCSLVLFGLGGLILRWKR